MASNARRRTRLRMGYAGGYAARAAPTRDSAPPVSRTVRRTTLAGENTPPMPTVRPELHEPGAHRSADTRARARRVQGRRRPRPRTGLCLTVGTRPGRSGTSARSPDAPCATASARSHRSWSTPPAAAARELAAQAAAGVDPGEDRRESRRRGQTLAEALEVYVEHATTRAVRPARPDDSRELPSVGAPALRALARSPARAHRRRRRGPLVPPCREGEPDERERRRRIARAIFNHAASEAKRRGRPALPNPFHRPRARRGDRARDADRVVRAAGVVRGGRHASQRDDARLSDGAAVQRTAPSRGPPR